jgi:hypothetical protein
MRSAWRLRQTAAAAGNSLHNRPMHSLARFALPLLAAIVGTVAALAAHAAPLPHNHPLLGTWTVSLPDGSCTETYWFRADGTSLITSGQEVAESQFEVSPEPRGSGFYELSERLTQDNGKPDCLGQVMAVGQQATHFLAFHPSGDLFLMCQDESLDTCIGPFRREAGLDT